MTQNIAFSDAEINELRNFYINELSLAEDRVKNIRAILSKIGTAPAKKRGRKAKALVTASEIQTPLATSAPKRRGRPRKNAEVVVKPAGKRRGRPSTKNVEILASPVKTGKRRGPRVKKALANIENLINSENGVTVAPAKKRGRKPGVKSGVTSAKTNTNETGVKKRGRKPGSGKKAATSEASNNTAVAKKPRGRKLGSGKKAAAIEAFDNASVAKKTRGRKPGAAKTITASANNSASFEKKSRGRKKNMAPANVENASANGNIESASKTSAKKSIKVSKAKTGARKESKPKAVKPAVVAKAKKEKVAPAPKPERQTKKKVMHDFINEILSSAPRFYTTDELVQRGIKKFNLKGKEKDTAKNSIQIALNTLQSESKIVRRRKEKDRQAYWALPSISDEGYIA